MARTEGGDDHGFQRSSHDEYIASLPEDRRTAMEAVRRVVGKALNVGKSCVRLRHLEDLPLDVIGETIAGRTWTLTRATRKLAARRDAPVPDRLLACATP